jgi:hypothetical protein
MVELENDWLRLRLDPARSGSAWSMIDKATEKDLALCQGYGTRVHPALFEILAGQPIAEGRVDALPVPFELKALRVDETGAATALFSGYPAPALHPVRLEKTCRLKPGRPQVEVDLAFFNEGSTDLPLAFWISSGVRIPEQDCAVFAPTPTGVIRTTALWHEPASHSVIVPRAAGGWTAAVSHLPPHDGLALAAPDSQVDSIWNWLGKFPGFTLGFGALAVTVPPGGVRRYRYTVGLLRGLPRVDGVTADLAGALELDDANVEPGQTRRVTVRLTACEARTARVSLTCRPAGAGGKPAPAAPPQQIELAPGRAAAIEFDVPFETADTLVLAATVTSGADSLRLERPVTVGVPRMLYRRALPRLEGSRFWGQTVGDRPLRPHTRTCDRKVAFPMVPWLAPAAGKRLKVFFIGEVSFNMAVFRDLARRGDFEWDFVQVWGTGDMRTGPYGRAEVERARRKIRRFKPDCILTAGIRYEDAPAELIEDLWRYAIRGGGLVLVGRDEAHCHGIWPGRLAFDAEPEAIDLAAPLKALFDSGIAPSPMGTIRPFRAGEGRIVMLDKQLDCPVLGPWGDEAPRNDLLPRYRGRTELPDWEYHFAQYLQLIRHAAKAEPDTTLRGLDLSGDQLEVRYASAAPRRACLEYEIVSADRLLARRGQANVDLQAGEHTLAVTLAALQANEYVLHAWLLEGPVGQPAAVEGGAGLILRAGHERPVLDFAATCQAPAGERTIDKIEIEGRRQPVPGTVTVTLSAEAASLAGAEVELAWRNGAFDRIVWSRREPLAGRTVVPFTGIAFVPVSHEGAVSVRLWDGDRIVAERAEPVQAWKAGDVAESEMAFLTAAGGEHDWYGTRMMQPWAEREAGLDFTYLRYGLQGAGFPWKRECDNKLNPPIVDERPLREKLAVQLKREFEELGNAYVNMSDEFRLGGEFDWSEPTLQVWRRSLAERYGSVDALNAQWETALASFDEARPVLLEEARRRPDNPSAWIDFRLFMDGRVNRRYEIATEVAAAISPRLKVGDSGAYAPGVGVGINYFTMIRASRFTMTYGGLRSDWVRSFLKEGDVVGVWLGYGWANPVQPWETLFRHYHILAWWGYLLHKRLTAHGTTSLVHLDLTPQKPFREIGRQQHEIRSGLGRLLRHARLAPPHALLPYSQASVYAGAVTGESHEEGANAAVVLLNERKLSYRFVADFPAPDVGAVLAPPALSNRFPSAPDVGAVLAPPALSNRFPSAPDVGAVLAPPALSGDQSSAGSASGAPTRNAAPLLLLFNTDALPPEAAQSYAKAITGGCSVMADAAAGTRDGYGRRLAASLLDAPFGVNRSEAVPLAASRFEPINWTAEASAELRRNSGQMVPALRGLRAEGGIVWARFGSGEPAIVARCTAGGGVAIMVNTRLPWVSSNKVEKALNPEDRPDELSPNETVGRLFDHLLACAGLRPFAGVESGSFKASLISRFDDGRARYFGLAGKAETGRLTVTLPGTGHTYEARSGRYFGCVSRVEDTVKKTDLAKVYAQLPYAVRGLSVKVTPRAAKPGETVTVSGRVMTAEGSPADQFHVVHAEVIDPVGERPAWHQTNLAAPEGRFELVIPLALNAPAGTWRVELRDAATGKRRLIKFNLFFQEPLL